MSLPEAVFYVAAACSIMITVGMVWHLRSKEKATLGTLHEMLDSAINNRFAEITYDETSLSALACKLNRFLKMSKLAEQNISAERTKIKELVSDISHQTKTPLANILLYIQLLQEQQELPEQAQQAAGAIAAQSEKLSFLIQSLVKISRLETGMLMMNPQNASVPALIAEAAESITQKAKSKKISLELTCAEENLQACFDTKWTEEALANILDNAVKYTPAVVLSL